MSDLRSELYEAFDVINLQMKFPFHSSLGPEPLPKRVRCVELFMLCKGIVKGERGTVITYLLCAKHNSDCFCDVIHLIFIENHWCRTPTQKNLNYREHTHSSTARWHFVHQKKAITFPETYFSACVNTLLPSFQENTVQGTGSHILG